MDAGKSIVAQLKGAAKSYGNVRALDGVDLAVTRRRTARPARPERRRQDHGDLRCCSGLLKPDAGEVDAVRRDPTSLDARRRIGVMLQTAGVPDTLTVGELITLFRSYYPDPRTFADVRGAGRRRRPRSKRRYGKLSGGQQRRVQFALAICGPRRDPVPRRADRRPRHRRARDAVEDHPHARRRRLRDRADHALPRRSRSARRSRLRARRQGASSPKAACSRSARASAQRRISCISSLDADAIARGPNVRSIDRDGERIEIVTDAAESSRAPSAQRRRGAERTRSAPRRPRRSVRRNHQGGRMNAIATIAAPRASSNSLTRLRARSEIRIPARAAHAGVRGADAAVPAAVLPAVRIADRITATQAQRAICSPATASSA